MSLSIFYVDGINSDIIDENEVRTFIKYCGYDGENPCLGVEVSAFSKELCNDNAVIDFKLKNIFKGTGWAINADKDNHELELIFRGWESCNVFIKSLEFAVSVLKEAKKRAMCKQVEPF